MNKRLLSGALSALLFAGVCMHLTASSASAALSLPTTSARLAGDTVYTITEAKIQFVVPASWQVEKDKDGIVTVSKGEGDDIFVATFTLAPPNSTMLTPEAQFKAFAEGAMPTGVKAGEVENVTTNGIPITHQMFTGKMNGVEMIGMIALLRVEKPVYMFLYGTLKKSEHLDKDADKLLDSIKQIK